MLPSIHTCNRRLVWMTLMVLYRRGRTATVMRFPAGHKPQKTDGRSATLNRIPCPSKFYGRNFLMSNLAGALDCGMTRAGWGTLNPHMALGVSALSNADPPNHTSGLSLGSDSATAGDSGWIERTPWTFRASSPPFTWPGASPEFFPGRLPVNWDVGKAEP